ncbi:phosphatidate cytidylyltransferase [Ancylomarina longa]|uniref:Phosphatidate cytidylyltransferase n=1 Tax=Ancylomarina longa TaxID=2487017 RepID=A0A434AG80_9BACT|nr:phosphatidate cytidylyltransferase [Ancylomarina longa]RUT73382.1 phosphatidate cytidylyltransferase [Ancylomarina longa]
MNNIIVLSFVYLVGIVLLLAFNELNYRRFKIKGEFTRKFAHFAATLATVPFPYIFPSHWYILVLALLFFAVLFITQYSKQLKSIHDIDRKSIGSYLLPLSIYLTFLISCELNSKILYILPMLILAICDPMAAILGMNIEKFNGRINLFGYKFNKTWLGSGAFLLTSFVISIIALYFNRELFDLKTFWLAFSIALISTLAELISWRGSDNLTIPLSVVLILVLFL